MLPIRIQFSKGYEVKYVSHLDLMRTFHRMLKRSGLPISYSQGFNPHIILTFAQPLSVGVTSDGEYAEFQLDEPKDFSELQQMLNDAAPEGIRILKVSDADSPKFKELYQAVYRVKLECNQGKEAILSCLSQPEILVEKKTKKGYKEVDIKPMVFSYEVEEEQDGLLLQLTLASGSENNLNPDLLLKAFERLIPDFVIFYKSVHRQKLLTKDARALI